ncbi:GTP-binding protein [Alteromonas pelagimontana]|uniref:GTP-binding protein n=1 Tax=Alteromonas pelagimontana TaxID=1858656 RepID=A0A6M4M9V9_9ALTE|nr:GTP-binding protein [Alteromonas pelagimontana]QJR79932.1 GTP-binding protein [Alteromonas pelagimontana]
MRSSAVRITAVPTNIITGFLGVGKSSAILNMLKHKPAEERWAVLVNEFGEIGVDGSLLAGQQTPENGIFIREVPGGCMCCAAGLPMQIALNQLLSQARPHRLLIEPAGLGHPVEVLQVLSAEHYRSVLSIQSVITLVDARKLCDTRYTTHATFNQQIAIADVIVGNKQDLYAQEGKFRLQEYAKVHASADAKIIFAQQGVFNLAWLQRPSATVVHTHHHFHNRSDDSPGINAAPFPASGYLKAVNEGEGYKSIGWRFSPAKTFDRSKLSNFFSGLHVERMKAVFITIDGVYGYNLTADALSQVELDDCVESRIEIIAATVTDEWETQLLSCIADQ